MRRRDFLLLPAMAMAWNQVSAKVENPRIGFVHAGLRQENHTLLVAFRDGLSALGWIDGSNVSVIDRWAEEHTEALPVIIKELIGSGAQSWSPPEHWSRSLLRARTRRSRSFWSASTIPSPLASSTR
jgi:hypothetical protein